MATNATWTSGIFDDKKIHQTELMKMLVLFIKLTMMLFGIDSKTFQIFGPFNTELQILQMK